MENYKRIVKEYKNISLRYTRGKIDIFPNKQFHSYYEIYLFLGGKSEFLNDHIKKPLEPYNLVIIPPGEYHCFRVDEEFNSYERCVLNIHTDFLNEDILKDAFCNKELLALTLNHRIVQNLLYLRDSAVNSKSNDFEYILSAIATDIVFLIKQSSERLKIKTSDSLNPVSIQIINYINENYKANIEIADIANYTSFSPSSVSHIFKKDFGVSLKKYITEKRMNEMYIHLKKGEKPLTVANNFGFLNYSTFYRSFKSYFGKSPSKI